MAQRVTDEGRTLLPLPFIPDPRLSGRAVVYGDRTEGKRVTLRPEALASLKTKILNLRCSRVLSAVLDYLLDLTPRTTKPITGLIITADKHLVASAGESFLIDCYIGTEWELLRNLSEICKLLELEPAEIDALSYQWVLKIVDDSRPGAAILL